MTAPLISEVIDNVGSGIQSKFTGEIVNWLWALLVLPVVRWIQTQFSRQQRRARQRRELENIKLAYELQNTFAQMTTEDERHYRDLYRDRIVKSEQLMGMMPPALAQTLAAEAAENAPPPMPNPLFYISVTQIIFGMLAPALFIMIGLTDTAETWEYRTMLALTGVLGAVLTLGWTVLYDDGLDQGFSEAFNQTVNGIIFTVIAMFAVMICTLMLGYEIPESVVYVDGE